MKCPHCLVDFHDIEVLTYITKDEKGCWGATSRHCSACGLAILSLICSDQIWFGDKEYLDRGRKIQRLIQPKVANRTPPSPNVPPDLAKDYNEACLVLGDSPQSSAALSRRCLQHLLRTYASVKHSDLAREIQEILDRNALPAMLAESIDAIRNIGNFAAHPIKSTASGQILDVEPGEAEWTLDVLESLFDYYFDQPALLQAKKAALNAKLASAGKPPLKK